MPRELRNIVVKELREIFRDPRLFLGIIIVPVLMLPLMGSGVRVASEAAQQQLAHMEIAVLNFDAQDGVHNLSDLFYAVLAGTNATVRNLTMASADEAVTWIQENDVSTLVVLPGNFTETILAGHSAPIELYQVLRSYAVTEAAGAERVAAAVASFVSIVTAQRLAGAYPGVPPGDLLAPVSMKESSVTQGRILEVAPTRLINAVAMGSLLIPLSVALMIVLASQLAATSVAMEKEQKTLEVLLTLPIHRVNILLGKLSGTIMVSLIGTVAMLLSFTYYMGSFVPQDTASVDLAAAGLAPDLMGYAFLAASLFLSMVAAMALSVLLAAYTKDVRSAQSLSGIIYIPVFIPAFLLMFSPVEILPPVMQGIIYAIPFSYSSLAAQAIYTKSYAAVAWGILYQVVFTAVVLWIAARFFASEKVLTARLTLRRKKAPVLEE
jgi:ABC-2 type transport system permease protein